MNAWTKRIDGVDIEEAGEGSSEVGGKELEEAKESVGEELVESLRVARERIVGFHKKELGRVGCSWFVTGNEIEGDYRDKGSLNGSRDRDDSGGGGGMMGQMMRPLRSVGFYIPGGTAPLPSTVLMSVLPALVSGVKELIVVSPPDRSNNGKIAAVTLAACAIVNELPNSPNVRVFRVGGAQAIGALAYGTATIPKVDKIVGPGNIFVSLAKKEVFGSVGIDGIFGPTEALIIADQFADPTLVAADLLAQAEHDFLAIPILITDNNELAEKVQRCVEEQVEKLSRQKIARHSLQNNGGIVIGKNLHHCIKLANDFAAEHVSLSIQNPYEYMGLIENAGGLFLGENSCEVLGDYVAGPSHTMPTGGSAKYSSPLSVMQFVKVVSVVGLDRRSVRTIAGDAERIARAEGLDGHANAAKLRKE